MTTMLSRAGRGANGHRDAAGRHERPTVRRRALLAAAALAVALALAACSTARRRDEPVGVGSLLSYRDASTETYFQDVYRTGSLYVDFRPALLVDAIVQDRRYRERYVDMLRERYLLPDTEVARLRAEQERQFETRISMLLFVYEGTNQPVELTRKDSPWQVFLRDDDGTLRKPESITRIAADNPAYLYVGLYFNGLDRWSRMYRVDFPKLSKAALGQPVGEHPVELLVTGVKGTVTLVWNNPGLFYAPKQTGASGAGPNVKPQRPAIQGATTPRGTVPQASG